MGQEWTVGVGRSGAGRIDRVYESAYEGVIVKYRIRTATMRMIM